jgi:hypothetical protein
LDRDRGRFGANKLRFIVLIPRRIVKGMALLFR